MIIENQIKKLLQGLDWQKIESFAIEQDWIVEGNYLNKGSLYPILTNWIKPKLLDTIAKIIENSNYNATLFYPTYNYFFLEFKYNKVLKKLDVIITFAKYDRVSFIIDINYFLKTS
jgi:hypothetical protein